MIKELHDILEKFYFPMEGESKSHFLSIEKINTKPYKSIVPLCLETLERNKINRLGLD